MRTWTLPRTPFPQNRYQDFPRGPLDTAMNSLYTEQATGPSQWGPLDNATTSLHKEQVPGPSQWGPGHCHELSFHTKQVVPGYENHDTALNYEHILMEISCQGVRFSRDFNHSHSRKDVMCKLGQRTTPKTLRQRSKIWGGNSIERNHGKGGEVSWLILIATPRHPIQMI